MNLVGLEKVYRKINVAIAGFNKRKVFKINEFLHSQKYRNGKNGKRNEGAKERGRFFILTGLEVDNLTLVVMISDLP